MAQRCADVDEFVERVKELYELDPARVRFVMKYRHADGSLALRATNDELWLLYRTTQASDIRRLEALQLWLMSAMAGSDVETLTREAAEADAAAAERREGKTCGGSSKSNESGCDRIKRIQFTRFSRYILTHGLGARR